MHGRICFVALPSQSPEDVVANGLSQTGSVVQNGRKPLSSSSSVGSDGVCKDRESKRSGRIRDAAEDFEFLEQSLNRPANHCENDADDLEDDGESGIAELRSENNHIGIIKNTVKSNVQKQGSVTPTLPSGMKRNKAINITGPCSANRETQCSRFTLLSNRCNVKCTIVHTCRLLIILFED